jgi:S-adenosylmethionine-diacylgycerolhomoserine-N-methlytransferase
MSVVADLRVLWHLLLTPVRGNTHSERLESFYRGQAAGYDNFRARLLPGRQQMYGALPVPAGSRWIDMGGGTGSNLEHLGERLPQLAELFLVDLSPSLLQVARQRVAERGWSNVRICQADATSFQPPGGTVDVVTFSYSLTMIPDWFAALEQAWRLLKPGGWIGVVDFYVSRKHSSASLAQHGWLTRTFWPAWFAMDNVFLSTDHLPVLQNRFVTERLIEGVSQVPYLPLGRVPYYVFIGRKSESADR